MSSSNCCTRFCGKLSINGSKSDLSNSINFICSKYNINKYQIADMPASDALICLCEVRYEKLSENVLKSAGAIKDLLCLKESNDNNFTVNEIDTMIEYICTA